MGVEKLDFICTGFAKSGTTTLYHVLSQHPQIYLSKIKEPVFWNDQTALRRGTEWYLNRYYKTAMPSQIVGEINPQLTNGGEHEMVVRKVLKKDGKIIFMLRNPAERLYSHFFMDLLWGSISGIRSDYELGNYNKAFDRFVEQVFKQFCRGNQEQVFKTDQFAFGNYSYYIREYCRLFGSENVYVLIFEEFVQDICKGSGQLFDFLGVRQTEGLNYNIKSNEGNVLPKNIFCMRMNRIWYYKVWPLLCRNININQKADEFMDRKLNWDMRTDSILVIHVHRKKMALKTRKYLEKIFAAEVQAVETFLGYSLKGLWY